jgi:tetratricopeptide (TPR) repeat protein
LRLHLQAIDKLNHALDSDPTNRVTLRRLGEAMTNIDRKTEAQSLFVRAINSDPRDSKSYLKFAVYLEQTHRYDEAERMYLRALRLENFTVEALVMYADFVTTFRQHHNDAEELYEIARRLDAKDPHALNNQACLLAGVKEEYARAIELWDACMALHQNQQSDSDSKRQLQESVSVGTFKLYDVPGTRHVYLHLQNWLAALKRVNSTQDTIADLDGQAEQMLELMGGSATVHSQGIKKPLVFVTTNKRKFNDACELLRKSPKRWEIRMENVRHLLLIPIVMFLD